MATKDEALRQAERRGNEAARNVPGGTPQHDAAAEALEQARKRAGLSSNVLFEGPSWPTPGQFFAGQLEQTEPPKKGDSFLGGLTGAIVNPLKLSGSLGSGDTIVTSLEQARDRARRGGRRQRASGTPPTLGRRVARGAAVGSAALGHYAADKAYQHLFGENPLIGGKLGENPFEFLGQMSTLNRLASGAEKGVRKLVPGEAEEPRRETGDQRRRRRQRERHRRAQRKDRRRNAGGGRNSNRRRNRTPRERGLSITARNAEREVLEARARTAARLKKGAGGALLLTGEQIFGDGVFGGEDAPLLKGLDAAGSVHGAKDLQEGLRKAERKVAEKAAKRAATQGAEHAFMNTVLRWGVKGAARGVPWLGWGLAAKDVLDFGNEAVKKLTGFDAKAAAKKKLNEVEDTAYDSAPPSVRGGLVAMPFLASGTKKLNEAFRWGAGLLKRDKHEDDAPLDPEFARDWVRRARTSPKFDLPSWAARPKDTKASARAAAAARRQQARERAGRPGAAKDPRLNVKFGGGTPDARSTRAARASRSRPAVSARPAPQLQIVPAVSLAQPNHQWSAPQPAPSKPAPRKRKAPVAARPAWQMGLGQGVYLNPTVLQVDGRVLYRSVAAQQERKTLAR